MWLDGAAPHPGEVSRSPTRCANAGAAREQHSSDTALPHLQVRTCTQTPMKHPPPLAPHLLRRTPQRALAAAAAEGLDQLPQLLQALQLPARKGWVVPSRMSRSTTVCGKLKACAQQPTTLAWLRAHAAARGSRLLAAPPYPGPPPPSLAQVVQLAPPAAPPRALAQREAVRAGVQHVCQVVKRHLGLLEVVHHLKASAGGGGGWARVWLAGTPPPTHTHLDTTKTPPPARTSATACLYTHPTSTPPPSLHLAQCHAPRRPQQPPLPLPPPCPCPAPTGPRSSQPPRAPPPRAPAWRSSRGGGQLG